MTCLTRLLLFTFIEEFATVLMHRGVHFYTREALGFGETENLLLALSGGRGGLIAVGLFVFGAWHGVSYYASLYYAMVTGSAAVKSAGMHEGLVGAGFVLGPAAALAGRGLGSLRHQAAVGVLDGVSPIVVVGAVGGLWPLLRANR